MSQHNLERENLILRARITQLEAALHQNERSIEYLFNLPPTLANLFGLLLAKEFVSKQLAKDMMNLVADANVAIWRLRERLLPMGITVNTRRGVGWYLDDETKQRVRTLMETHQPIGASHGQEEGRQAEEQSLPAQEGGEEDGEEDEKVSYIHDDIDAEGYNITAAVPADGDQADGWIGDRQGQGQAQRQEGQDEQHRQGDGQEPGSQQEQEQVHHPVRHAEGGGRQENEGSEAEGGASNDAAELGDGAIARQPERRSRSAKGAAEKPHRQRRQKEPEDGKLGGQVDDVTGGA